MWALCITGAEPELEGLSDESQPNEGDHNEVWGRPPDGVSDVGSAFDGLNLSTVPSQVRCDMAASCCICSAPGDSLCHHCMGVLP